MIGQINLDSKLGKIIYDFVSMPSIKNIVEIGTWNGYGSTQCIKQSILDFKKQDYLVYSLEINKEMHEIAKKNIEGIPNFNLLLGSIIDELDFNWFDWNQYFNSNEGYYEDGMNFFSKKPWLLDDIENVKKVENVFYKIPKNIDLLILDGGEFSTYPEYIKLKDRTIFIILDDTKEMKCKKIREEILSDDNYEIIYDEFHDRNGFLVAKKK